MSLRIALVLALLFGILIAYLSSLNTEHVRVAFTQEWTSGLPLMVVVMGAFFMGAAVAFLIGALRSLTRSYRDCQLARRVRRTTALDEIYHRGVQAQLAGRTAAAAQAYEELLRREPDDPDVAVRLGELARQRGDTEAALSHHLQALRADERPETLLKVADDYRYLGRPDDATGAYQRLLAGDHDHLTALRGLRDVAVEQGRWPQALEAQERVVRVASGGDRAAEQTCLAAIHYELGRTLLGEGPAAQAVHHFKEALRARSDFTPAALLLGDAQLDTGDAREALRTWERALDAQLALPLLHRIEQLYRAGGRPTRMISLYQEMAARQPDHLALAFGLGRVYFELAMLDESAEQFEKMEVRAQELPLVHAYLGAIFERRGQVGEALEEYRRALRSTGSFDWAHRCVACGAGHPHWVDRCPSCRRWNTSRS